MLFLVNLVEPKIFFSRYKRLFQEKLDQEREKNITHLLEFIRTDPAITDIRWAAYMLATTKHETAHTWAPIVERGSIAYFTKRYWSNERVRVRLGNLTIGDAASYRGRGYVQITGRRNYAVMGGYVGTDILSAPHLALDPTIAYRIMSIGMRYGYFTGKHLRSYLNEKERDYVNARRIINGLDRAKEIATYATLLEKIITPSSTFPIPIRNG